MVNVAHYRDDRCAWHLDIVGIGGDQFFELFFSHHVLEGDKRDVIAKPFAQVDRDAIVERLIDRGEDTALQQQADNFFWLNAKLLCELFDRRALNQTYWL